MVNITESQQNHLNKANSGLEINFDTALIKLPNGIEISKESISITDDCSDFIIEYVLNKDKTYSLNTASEYIKEELPYRIENTRQLTTVCKYIVANY